MVRESCGDIPFLVQGDSLTFCQMWAMPPLPPAGSMSVNELESSLIVYALSHHSAAVVILSGVVLKGLISSDFAASVVDSLTSSICIVDLAGTIVGVNRA